MNPAEMCDAELSEAVAVEIHDWERSTFEDQVFVSPKRDVNAHYWGVQKYSISGPLQQWMERFTPATDDAQALAAFDRAAELVGARNKEYHWDESGEFAAIRWNTESATSLTRMCRPRALSECAVAAVRSFREMGGVT